MTYVAIVEIAYSASLQARISACAAEQGITDPIDWTKEHIWKIAATPGWADDWAYAEDTATPNNNPDTGARNDVIGDEKILSAVQALLAQEQAPPAE